jgi:PAS domain S-box-containing protein
MDRTTLVSKFAETVGVEKASTMVEEAMADLGLADGQTMTNMDARDVCEVIQHDYDGYIALVASELRVQLAAQEQFDALLENIPNPAVVVEFDQREPHVTSVNEAFESAFGYDRADAIGTALQVLLAPSEADQTAVATDWWEHTGQSEQEVTRATASGEVRTYLFRSVIVTRESGEVEGYGIYTDITERKRREQQLKHQNERLDEFVSIVSHDLRNPLSVAAGQTEYLLDTVEDETIRERLAAISSAHDRMARLLDDTLELARQGQVVGETAPVDVATIATDAWEQVETADATLTVEAEATVEADSERFQALFENLFRNSVEHGSTSSRTESDDSVEHGSTSSRPGADDSGEHRSNQTASDESTDHAEAETTVVVADLGPTGQNGVFVADDGPGIPEEERTQVFEHGYTTTPSGTGFGLSIVQSIAEAHGWTVTVTASESGGARFEIRW